MIQWSARIVTRFAVVLVRWYRDDRPQRLTPAAQNTAQPISKIRSRSGAGRKGNIVFAVVIVAGEDGPLQGAHGREQQSGSPDLHPEDTRSAGWWSDE